MLKVYDLNPNITKTVLPISFPDGRMYVHREKIFWAKITSSRNHITLYHARFFHFLQCKFWG